MRTIQFIGHKTPVRQSESLHANPEHRPGGNRKTRTHLNLARLVRLWRDGLDGSTVLDGFRGARRPVATRLPILHNVPQAKRLRRLLWHAKPASPATALNSRPLIPIPTARISTPPHALPLGSRKRQRPEGSQPPPTASPHPDAQAPLDSFCKTVIVSPTVLSISDDVSSLGCVGVMTDGCHRNRVDDLV
jgi:hypothetical protein